MPAREFRKLLLYRTSLLFFTALLFAGLFLFYKTGLQYNASRVDLKGKTPQSCTVIDSFIDQQKGDETIYRPVVRYKYAIGGLEYNSSNYSGSLTPSNDYSQSANLILKYSYGTRIACFVNPSDPADSIAVDNTVNNNEPFIIPFICSGFFALIGLIGLAHRLITRKAKLKA